MAMKVVTPKPQTTTNRATIMKQAHALAKGWMSNCRLVIIGDYADFLKIALRVVWATAQGRAPKGVPAWAVPDAAHLGRRRTRAEVARSLQLTADARYWAAENAVWDWMKEGQPGDAPGFTLSEKATRLWRVVAQLSV